MSSSTSVIERQRARAIVDGVNRARGKALEGFRLLAEAKAELGTLFGTGYNGGYADHLWEDRIYDSALQEQARVVERAVTRLKVREAESVLADAITHGEV